MQCKKQNSKLNIPGYRFEYENNNVKRRVGIYIKNCIKYKRMEAFEGQNAHIIIIDLVDGNKSKKRIVNLYGSFNPNGETAKKLFVRQLCVIRNVFNNDTVLLGDFNLDFRKRHDLNYQRKDYFELFEEKLGEFHLMQLVKVDTWSHLVGSELRSSL